ncbi:ATP-binding protein [Sporolactobacillus sp. STCC-11]|uniref:ATP-binding protein n=1 Tax=Sporolactobacillus caesalpiniae TaxID=3230362 RepID=UPI0033946FD0
MVKGEKKLSGSDVFRPGDFPQYTYVSRKSPESVFTYEQRLRQALNTPGFLTSIIGPSKIGKTVLCEKVLGVKAIVSLSGADFRTMEDGFWLPVANKLGLSFEGERIEKERINDGLDRQEEREIATKQKYGTKKDRIINYFVENELVLVLDDFHYATAKLQFDIAYQLKDAIRKGLKVIVISLPHRADDAIRKNPDLSGRLSLINMLPWETDELKQIAVTGFQKLGISITDEQANLMAQESLASPQLMQSICLNLSFLTENSLETELTLIGKAMVEQSFKATTSNLPYLEIVKKLEDGPPTRGQKRKTYTLINGDQKDIYSIILMAVAKDPPVLSVSFDEMRQRIDLILQKTTNKLSNKKIKDSLRHIKDIMSESELIYQVFEWKDNQLYILDPLFLFFIRWGFYSLDILRNK